MRCAPPGSKTSCAGTRPFSGKTPLQSICHRGRDSLAYFLRLHLQLLFAVDDHACFEEHGGSPRGLEHDEIVVVMHSVPAVGKGLVLPRDRIGVIERGRETGAA